MKRSDYPFYNSTLNFYLDGDLRTFNRHRTSKDLGRIEKRLLEARAMIVRKEWREAIKMLDELTVACDFLNADKFFLLATLKSSIADFQGSAINNARAIILYKKVDDRRGLFVAHYNSSVAFNRLGAVDFSNFHITRAEKLANNPNESLLIARAKACHLSKQEDFEGACKILDENLLKQENKKDLDLLNFKSVAIDIYFRADRKEDALRLLKEMKSSKANRSKGRVAFQYHVLKAMINGDDIGHLPMAVESSEQHSLQWKVLKSLQDGDNMEARELWSKLCQDFSNLYAENFKCKSSSEEKTIFIQYLRSLFNKTERPQLPKFNLKGKKLNSLLDILVDSPTSMRKEEIIEKIWNTKYCPSYDARFYQMIKRLKNLTGINIANKNNSYKIAT